MLLLGTVSIYMEGSCRPGADLAAGGQVDADQQVRYCRYEQLSTAPLRSASGSKLHTAIRLQSGCAVPAFALKQQYAMCCSFLGQ
jgi:hypothetical protein